MSKGLFNRLETELEARETSSGLYMSDLLTLPEPVSGLLNWMLRQGSSGLADVSAFLQQDKDCTRTILVELREKGFVREIEIRGVVQYRVRLAPKRGRTMPGNLWKALDDKAEQEEEKGQ